MPETKQYVVRSPRFPDYTTVRHLMRIWEGIPHDRARDMIHIIHAQLGTPQNPVDWSDPDTWIPERLQGDIAALAMRTWRESKKHVNPRYCYAGYRFIDLYGLLNTDDAGIYRVSDAGRAFLQAEKHVLRELDEQEGIFYLLDLLAVKPGAWRKDLLDDWREYLNKCSKFGSDSTMQRTISERLSNLMERGYVKREGIRYTITDAGREYLGAVQPKGENPKQGIAGMVQAFNTEQRARLKETLHNLPPVRFEELVGALLEAMDYQDVEVTKVSGDKGIDVVGNVQFGITTVTEVVQVKRQRNNVGRPILDQLRGCLPLHKAIRGTLITLSDFSQGCKEAAVFPGAAPITLINGEELVRMLVKYNLGVAKTPLELEEVDDTFLNAYRGEEGEE